MHDLIPSHPLAELLKLSCEAAVLIVLVLAAQWVLGRRLSPRWRYGLWLLVVARLALPWTIPSTLSVFNYLSLFNSSTPSPSQAMRSSAAPAGAQAPTTFVLAGAASHSGANLLQWAALIWGAGALGLYLLLAMTHFRLWRRVTPCRPLIDTQVLNLLEDCKHLMGVRVPVSLVETAAVDGPCLFGFLRPRLLLPPGFTRHFSPNELRHVFLHELGHIKGCDIPLSWLAAFLQILHWFNPLVWFAFSRMRADRELACDALALAHAGDQESKPYGLTIVKLLEGFSDSLRPPSLAGIVEGKQQMQERIRMIARFQRTNRGTTLAGILFVSLGLLTLTDAKPAAKTPTTTDASAAPRIVNTTPKIGARNVDPALTEITVTFDQDMKGGYSWTGGGADFPPTPDGAKIHWRDARTCVLPVKIGAAHYYRVGINSKSYQGFTSARGTPALPSAIFFTTKGASEKLKAMTRPPRVVRFEPDNGAKVVSPAVAEVRVTFNVPMGGGFSWCTAGDDDHDFPKSREGKDILWTADKKTCVLPVRLEAGMTYRLFLNASSYNNFQSDAGVPLEPVSYTFQTSDKP